MTSSYDRWLEQPYVDRARIDAEIERLEDQWMVSAVGELMDVLPEKCQTLLEALVTVAAERQWEETSE